MATKSRYSHSHLGRVRAYFGFSQRELAAYLGITESLANHLEAGRRTLSPEVAGRLAPLLGQLREGAADVPLPFGPPAGPLDPAPLEARRDACLHQARGLRQEMRQLPGQARQAARWARALPALQAALPPVASLPSGADLAAQFKDARLTYVRNLLAQQSTTLSPDVLSRWHLLLVRAQALEAEAAALSALLG